MTRNSQKQSMAKQDEPKSQADRFKQAAKEVGADESEAAFEDKLRKLALGIRGKNKNKKR